MHLLAHALVMRELLGARLALRRRLRIHSGVGLAIGRPLRILRSCYAGLPVNHCLFPLSTATSRISGASHSLMRASYCFSGPAR